MYLKKGEKVSYLVSANGALIKVSEGLEGHPQIPTSGYFNVIAQETFEPLFEISETPKHDREVAIDQSVVVYSSNGDVFCKYIGFIN